MKNRLRTILMTIVLAAIANLAAAQNKANPTAQQRALSPVTKEDSVLVLVDYTDGLMPIVKTITQEKLRNNTVALAKLGKIFKLPTLVLGDEGGFRGTQIPELMAIVKGDQFFPRHTPSAWKEKTFREAVAKTGRKNLIMAGISTDNCVALLALDALRAGYKVTIVTDAGGSDSKLAEETALNRLSAAGAVAVNWVQLASELMVDWDTPEGPAVGKVYQDHLDAGMAPQEANEGVARLAFRAWEKGESSGDYTDFKNLLSKDFNTYSHPLSPKRGSFSGASAKQMMDELIAGRTKQPNKLSFSNVVSTGNGTHFTFSFDSKGTVAGGYPYEGYNSITLIIKDAKVVGFREYLGDIDPSWFTKAGGGR
jgi:nicotinamidase-related amidase